MERCVPVLALYAEPERWPNGLTNPETAMNNENLIQCICDLSAASSKMARELNKAQIRLNRIVTLCRELSDASPTSDTFKEIISELCEEGKDG